MRMRFTKEDMPTAAGFVRDSFQTDQAAFEEIAPDDFGAAFLADLEAKLLAVSKATGGALRASSGTQTTTRLYENLVALRPLLDRLDIRLGLLPPSALTVKPGAFGLKRLRERLDARDVEAVSQGLTVLQQAIQDNLAPLQGKGYKPQELTELQKLHQAIDADNAQQNTNLNKGIGSTQAEDADYKALDALLGQVLRVGRLLYKADKPHRRQYEVAAILQRVHAAGPKPGDNPKA